MHANDATAPIALNERRLAGLMGISAKSVYRLRQLGLPHVKIGGLILFRPAAVDAWLAEREQTANSVDETKKPLVEGHESPAARKLKR